MHGVASPRVGMSEVGGYVELEEVERRNQDNNSRPTREIARVETAPSELPRVSRRPHFLERMGVNMGRASQYSPEVRERAVRMLFEHQREYESQWAAMASIALKIGCTAETLRKWVRQAERNGGNVRD